MMTKQGIALFFLICTTALTGVFAQSVDNVGKRVFFRNISNGIEAFPDAKITSIAIDKDDTKWVATEKGLVAFYADSTVRQFNRTNTYDTLIYQVSSIKFDRKGNIWLGTFSDDVISVVSLDSYGEYLWHTEIPSFSNKSFYINAIDVDSRGGKWIATAEGGLWHISANGKRTLYNNEIEPNIPSDRMNAVLVDDKDVVWVGSDMGMFTIKNGKFADAYDVVDGYGYDNIQHIDLNPDGNVCVTALNRRGKQHLICNQEMFRMAKKVSRASNFRFNDVLVAPNYAVWIAGNEGLVKFSKEEEPIIYNQDSGLVVSAVTALANDVNGDIWLGTQEDGLFKMQFGNIEVPQEAEIVATVVEEVQLEQPDTEIKIDVDPTKEIASIDPIKVKDVPKVVFENKEIKKGEAITLENITFNIKSYTLSSVTGVEKLFNFMIDNPNVKIELSGHTDRDPHPSHPSYERIRDQQLDLSKKRVTTVYNYLVRRGIDASRIDKKAYGGSKPLVDRNSSQNRRVEMKILEVE